MDVKDISDIGVPIEFLKVDFDYGSNNLAELKATKKSVKQNVGNNQGVRLIILLS